MQAEHKRTCRQALHTKSSLSPVKTSSHEIQKPRNDIKMN